MFLNERTLFGHKKQFHGENNLKCDYCDYKTYANYKLREHIEYKHMEQTKYPCSKCSYVSNIKSMLNNHVKNVHEGGKKSYDCPQCSNSFNNKGKFAAHLLADHNIIYKY